MCRQPPRRPRGDRQHIATFSNVQVSVTMYIMYKYVNNSSRKEGGQAHPGGARRVQDLRARGSSSIGSSWLPLHPLTTATAPAGGYGNGLAARSSRGRTRKWPRNYPCLSVYVNKTTNFNPSSVPARWRSGGIAPAVADRSPPRASRPMSTPYVPTNRRMTAQLPPVLTVDSLEPVTAPTPPSHPASRHHGWPPS